MVVSWKEELESFGIEPVIFDNKNKEYQEKFVRIYPKDKELWGLCNYELLRCSGVNLHNLY